MRRIALVLVAFLLFFAQPATAQDDHFDFIIKGEVGHLATVPYERDRVWLDGDRVGYHLLYAFLDCNTLNATLNLRVSAFGYNGDHATALFDRYMNEGTRRWNGTIEPDGEIPAKESDAPTRFSHGAGYPTSVPVIEVHRGPVVCEIRDYGAIADAHEDLTWAVIKDTPTEVIIGWYVDGEPAVEFYYEIIGGAYRLDVVS